jgi:hypothetical protein
MEEVIEMNNARSKERPVEERCHDPECKGNFEEKIEWVQCRKCQEWYHRICVNMSMEDWKLQDVKTEGRCEEDLWMCETCKKEKGQKEEAKRMEQLAILVRKMHDQLGQLMKNQKLHQEQMEEKYKNLHDAVIKWGFRLSEWNEVIWSYT